MKLDSIQIDVSPGELIDKITILQIKADKIQDFLGLYSVRLMINMSHNDSEMIIINRANRALPTIYG